MLAPDGTLVSRSYVLIEEIGRGATGTVWHARDRATGREYAIKILRDDQADVPKAVARFLQERSILLRLRHENLVAVHDLLTTSDGNLALVLDLVRGGTLRDLLHQRDTMPSADATDLLAQVAAGLAAAHAAGVVHRDLKPDNILLGMRPDGGTRVRLTDFGIARLMDGPRLTTTGAVLGTPNYMAPEVIEGKPAGPAADVYALGILLYELIVGRPPFDDGCDAAILVRHTRAVARPVTGMPPRIWALVQACLERDPARRPAAATLVDTLRRLSTEYAGMPALTPPPADGPMFEVTDPPTEPPARPRTPPNPRRPQKSRTPMSPPLSRRAVTPALAVLAVLVLGVAGYSAMQLDGRMRSQRDADLPSTQAMPPGGAAVASPAPATAPTAPRTVPPGAGAGAASTAPPQMVAPARTRAEDLATSPVAAQPSPTVGPWLCTDTYRWAVAHPVVGEVCQSTGTEVLVRAALQTSPGVTLNASMVVHDEAGGVAAGPVACPGLRFTEAQTERVCGPATVPLASGRRYVVEIRWTYTGAGILPPGSIRGDPFDR